ncbi:MAG: nucleotidyltransferase domain-containing protein [Candidatus Cloacimonetes bacterium]|nr:nucleotidyltransferase domain-containing protein [Candidatus Cloacimonadota bacterium]
MKEISMNEIITLLRAFKNDNKERYRIEKLGLFGSYVKGNYSYDSDVDIVIETNTVDLFKLVHLKEELEKFLNKKVDIVRYRKRMNSYLKQHIDEEAIYV